MKTLTVELAERSYPIYIGSNLLADSVLLTRHVVADQILIVSNETIAALHLAKIKAAFKGKQCDVVLIPDGEQFKNLATLNKIFDELLAKNHRRNTTIIALGGGVVCDISGFAAACYQRAVAFIQIPTSLLAQVDASIGGKTAVNHALGKNMIGAFHQPKCVIIDTQVLQTLPERELYAGIAEIIKAALIRDAEFFVWLEKNMPSLLQHNSSVLAEAIARACAIKAIIVAADEHELTGERALLNFGHTLGHAIEQVLGYGQWLHGEAVAAGMVFAARVSGRMGFLTQDDIERIERIILQAHLPIQLPAGLQYDKIKHAMGRDKKLQDSTLRLVLLKQLGNAELMDVIDEGLIKAVYESLTK